MLQVLTAAAFRQKTADVVVRALGGDESLIEEIRANAATQQQLPDNHPMRVFGQSVVAKRTLDGDEQVYAAKKQQLLSQISQQTIKQHAHGSMSILAILSVGSVALATMQLLQTIRHNVTTRLGSVIESGTQGMLAIEGAPQRQQQDWWTVQMYANKLGLSATACTADKLKAVGVVAAKIWSKERLLPTIARNPDGLLYRVCYKAGSNTPERATFHPEPHLFKARMKYDPAYKGGYEASDRANFDTWTYPTETGGEVLREAFCKVQAHAAIATM